MRFQGRCLIILNRFSAILQSFLCDSALLRFYFFCLLLAAEFLAIPGLRFWESCDSRFAILCCQVGEHRYIDQNIAEAHPLVRKIPAPIKIKLALPPPPFLQSPGPPSLQKEGFYGHGVFQQKEPKKGTPPQKGGDSVCPF